MPLQGGGGSGGGGDAGDGGGEGGAGGGRGEWPGGSGGGHGAGGGAGAQLPIPMAPHVALQMSAKMKAPAGGDQKTPTKMSATAAFCTCVVQTSGWA